MNIQIQILESNGQCNPSKNKFTKTLHQLQTRNIYGFTLMELMIVVAIIGILVAIAIPSYKIYTKRAHFTELVQAAAPFKIGIEECFQTMNTLDECIAGQHGVPPALNNTNNSALVSSIQVDKGVITVIPKEKYGIAANDTYVLTPQIDNGLLTWNPGGGAVANGYVH